MLSVSAGPETVIVIGRDLMDMDTNVLLADFIISA
jgi:hypothetical protein